MKLVDLSVPIVHGLPVDPPPQIPQIEYIDHQLGAESMLSFFPGAGREDLPDGCGWAVENIRLSTHTGTHVDAPWHYHPTMNGGEPAWTIDQVPLDWFIGPGVLVDFHDKPDGYLCTPEDFRAYFEQIGYTLSPGDVVLLRTSAMDAWGTPAYLNKGCGVGREATLWLAGQGVHLMGTDAWSWDVPLSFEARRFAETGCAGVIWEGHKAGAEIAYCHMEKLANLDALPPFGFQVIAFPVKVAAAGAGWCRAVAVLEA